MSFIRGTYGVCAQCASELNLRSDVKRIVKFGYGFEYQGKCPSCGAQTELPVDRAMHKAGVAYMRQVALDKSVTDVIVKPVNEAEQELQSFQDFLNTANTETIWAELHASS